jgi:hypothetical protein
MNYKRSILPRVLWQLRNCWPASSRLPNCQQATAASRHHVAKKQRRFDQSGAFDLERVRAAVAYMAKWLRS